MGYMEIQKFQHLLCESREFVENYVPNQTTERRDTNEDKSKGNWNIEIALGKVVNYLDEAKCCWEL